MHFSFCLPSLAAFSIFITGIRAALSTTGTTVFLNDVAYYIPPAPVGSLQFPATLSAESAFVPITVLQTTSEVVATDISVLVANFTIEDDVYQSGFLEHTFIQQVGIASRFRRRSASIANCTVVPVAAVSSLIPTGPYFLTSSGDLHQAYRLYPDSQGAFTETVIEALAGSYSVLPAGIVGQVKAVAVPSRLYYTATAEKPLAGIYHLSNFETLFTNIIMRRAAWDQGYIRPRGTSDELREPSVLSPLSSSCEHGLPCSEAY